MGMYPTDINGAAGAALGIIAVVLIAYLVAFGLGIAMYILQALGLYTLAQRRGIKHPWMAWLPVTNMWILGSIADQYRYVAHGQIRNRRKVLLGLLIAIMVLWLVFFCVYIGLFVNMAVQIPQFQYMAEAQIMRYLGTSMLWLLVVLLLCWIVAVIAAVFQYICLYDLYASCCPDHKVLFLVLSILVNVTMPFFVFACRKKDGGMPPRRDEIPPVLTTGPEVFHEE